MKPLLFLLAAMLFAASPVLSQTRKAKPSKSKRPSLMAKSAKTTSLTAYSSSDEPPPPPSPKPQGKQSRSSEVFRDVAVGKWGVVILSVPDDLSNESDTVEPTSGKRLSWITYSRSWKQDAEYHPSALEVNLVVKTWDTDFKTIVPDLRPDLATPENMLLLDLAGDERNKNVIGSFVKESHRLAIGGVEGVFFRAEYPSDNNRFLTGWYTYRYFEGKAQSISLNITGKQDELPKAMKIIQSLRLQQSAETSRSGAF